MLDITFIRENVDLVRKATKDKGTDGKALDRLLAADQELLVLRRKVEQQRARMNEGAKEISRLADADRRQKAIAEMAILKKTRKDLEARLLPLELEFADLMLRIPAPALDTVPIGKTDKDNVEVRTWGDKPTFGFEPLDHVTLGERLDIIDIPRGVKISGSRFYFLKNEGALLELALLRYTLDKLVAKGFTPFIPPVLVQQTAMMGTGYFPGGEEQAYAVGVKHAVDVVDSVDSVDSVPLADVADVDAHGGSTVALESDGLFLVGTSEVSVASYHYNELLDESELPKLYAGISPCFRREAGTYGKDTQGLYRIHQFQKVEQVVICKNDPEESRRLHELILANAEEVLQDLKLPYRVVDVCTGDMGAGQVFKNDIETWMPSRQSYGETHSCSTFWEYQARRLKLRYKTDRGEKKFCHTLNNTCIASPRILIPILEIYQQKDGSVVIPEILRPLMGGREKIVPKG